MINITGKQNFKNVFPRIVHKSWQICSAFDEKILQDVKSKLKMPTNPTPDKIFEPFAIDVDRIKWVVVNNTYPLVVDKDTPYSQYPIVLKGIWDKLEESEGWHDGVERYLQPDLSDWDDCLKLTLSLTEKQGDIWKEFMDNLFDYFEESPDRYLFVFMDNESFKYANGLKVKHEIHYGFEPNDIREYFKHQWGENKLFGLPF